MKNFLRIVLILVSLFVLSQSYAEESVSLEVSGFNNLKAPESMEARLERVNYRSEISTLSKYDKMDYFEAEEEIFESKTGQMFSKFINDRAINNKVNRLIAD